MTEDPTPQWQNDNEEAAAVVEHTKTGAAARPARRAASKKAVAQTSVTNPVGECSAAGATSSGWLKVGDGKWRGWLKTADGHELEIEQLADGRWSCVTDETVARTLQLLLQKLLDQNGNLR